MTDLNYYAIVNKQTGKYVSSLENGPKYTTDIKKIEWIFSLFTFRDTKEIANLILQEGLKENKNWAKNSEVRTINFTPELIAYQKERFYQHLETLRKEVEKYEVGYKIYSKAKIIYNSLNLSSI